MKYSRNSLSPNASRLKPAHRCAIYTRKSCEEGLELEFNSLHAQRESAEAFIASQQHEGWECLPEQYDDGGFSGGSLDRPALNRLLEDIKSGKIDCVVVYKVDRLSRSLLDFSRIMETFDKYGVSFVSVTQQFNTTHSMGRLTLNILLSFAQFEREIIGERIRDKIAAQRRKGKWSGGIPILGYDVDRSSASAKLVVNAEEAVRVRRIFSLYQELGTLLPVVQDVNQRGWLNKEWTTKSGLSRGGKIFDKCSIYTLLTNPLYAGLIRHKDLLHKGEHEPIIEASMFDAVQKQLKKNGRGRGNQLINQHGAILKGILRCSACDHAMVHTFTRKKEKIYRYYSCTQAIKSGRDACPTPNLPAAEIEQAVLDQIRSIGADAEIQNLVIAQIQSGQNKQIEELETNRQQLQRQLSRDHAELGKLAIISDPTGATSRDVVFARGLLWNDSQQVRSAIARCSKPILITSRQMKTKIPWRNAPLALSLDLIASMLDRFNLDVDEIIAILAERSDNPDKSAIEVPTAEDLKLLVRRQIKAEQKTELTDAVLVQAYLQEGSIRKAAEFLTSQTGHFISKDKVQRAVQRSGGIDSLVDGKDSNSIVRGVASQCRDSRGNLLIKEIPAN